MATMNFNVPDDIKERFNRTFAGANKSGHRVRRTRVLGQRGVFNSLRKELEHGKASL